MTRQGRGRNKKWEERERENRRQEGVEKKLKGGGEEVGMRVTA